MTSKSRLYNLSIPVAAALVGLPLALAGANSAGLLAPFKIRIQLAIANPQNFWILRSLSDEGPRQTYDTRVAENGTIRKIVSTSGPVRAMVTVSVGSQLSGQIDKLFVDYNSEVKEGDVMATLDARTFEARVAQARADLLAAKAGLLNQEAALKRSQAVFAQAERARARQTALQKKGFAATATLENAQRDLDIAKAEIDVAKAQIESANAVVAQREAALQQSQVDLERTRIVAPVNGIVISRTIDTGQTVAASLQAPELFKIAQDIRRIRIEAQVNEADVGAVAEGNPVTFTVDAYPERTFQGKVTQVRLAATELGNVVTYTVIIEASNDDRRLFPGMTANVQIEAAKKDGVLRIANEALRFKPRVETVSDDRGDRPERMQRRLERMREELNLTDAQVAAVREEMQKAMPQRTAGQGSGQQEMADPAAARQRMQAAIETALKPLLTDEQLPAYEKWKSGREAVRTGNVHVLTDAGEIDRRFVRLGISDEQYTEIVGGQLQEGERVVVRARSTQ